MSTSARLIETTIRHQVFLERLKSGQVKKFDPFLREIDRRLRGILSRGDITAFQRDRVEAMVVEVRGVLSGIYDRFGRELQGELFELSSYEAAFEAKAIGNSVAGFTPAVPGPNQVWAAVVAAPMSVRGTGGGKLLATFIKDWSVADVESVTGAIRQGFFEGQTNAQIVQRIRGTKAAKYTDGLLAVSERHASAVVRTAVQHVASVARVETWRNNADIVTGYRWVSTLDSKTTDACQSLDGRVFKQGEGPLPPIHINCRSTTTAELDPVFDFLKQGAERATVDGPVPASQSYFDWLKGQPASFQDEAIGPVRAALFRDGGLSADRFAALQLDRNFQPLTLAEMAKLEPLAFERAGIKP